MRIALIHDDFIQAGGAENLFATIASIYKDAPIYTSLVDWQKLPASINHERIKTSFLQKIPFARSFYKALLPLYPFAFETFNFDEFDLVISSTTRFAKSIITKPKTKHICYINSLPRFLYNPQAQEDYLPKFVRIILKPFLKWLKRWDSAASSRADLYIANSQNVKNSIKKVYNRSAEILYPCVDTNFFRPAKIHKWNLKSQQYFLIVTRLVKWKKIEVAIEACQKLGHNLKIVGIGPDQKRLQKLAVNRKSDTGSEIEFLGRVTQEGLRMYLQNCQALIVTQEEDFGIATVEAQACGKAVIAYGKGGQAEIIIDGKTGLFFDQQLADSIKDAIGTFFKLKWFVKAIRQNALRFTASKFRQGLEKLIASYAS